MIKHLTILAFCTGFLIPSGVASYMEQKATASAMVEKVSEPIVVSPKVETKEVRLTKPKPITVKNTGGYNNLVHKYASKYGVDHRLINAIISCENYGRIADKQSDLRYNFTKKSLGIYKGEREYSFGLVQINLHYNPNVTYAQAIDPDFSIDFLAKNLSKGRYS